MTTDLLKGDEQAAVKYRALPSVCTLTIGRVVVEALSRGADNRDLAALVLQVLGFEVDPLFFFVLWQATVIDISDFIAELVAK